MKTTTSMAEQRKQARALLRDRLDVSSDLAEEICRRLTNDVVRLLMAETAHGRSAAPRTARGTAGPQETETEDDIIDIPELAEEVPELNDYVLTGQWYLVTITDPIEVRDNKLRIRGVHIDKNKVLTTGRGSTTTYRFWDDFNTELAVATKRFRSLREAAGLDPAHKVRRGELIGATVYVSYEKRDTGKVMVQDYKGAVRSAVRSASGDDPFDKGNEG